MAESQCVGGDRGGRDGGRENIRICEYLNLKLCFINSAEKEKRDSEKAR